MSSIVGPVSSTYVMAAAAKQSEYALKKEETEKQPVAQAVPSQYAAQGMENIVTLEENPVYQTAPQPINRHHVVPGAGVPLSAAQLKERVAQLEDKVYTPALIDGALYFVSADNDTKTARSSDEPAPEPTFTMAQLQHFFGEEVANKFASTLTKSSNSSTQLGEPLRRALNSLSKTAIGATGATSSKSITGSDLTSATAVSRTMLTAQDTLSVNTAAGRDDISWGPTRGVTTAVSRTMLTGAEASDPARTARSRTTFTGVERTASTHSLGGVPTGGVTTAVSRTMLTGAEASDPAVTAVSRTMLTGAEASDPAVTAVSRTMLTAADKSASCITGRGPATDASAQTAVSRTMLTAAERSLSTTTAHGEFWDELKTAWERSEKTDELRTALSASTEALAKGSMAEIAPFLLTTTPSTDPTAANAVPSIDTMTAVESRN